MRKREKMVMAEFEKDHTFFLRGTLRAVSAKQMKEKKVKFRLPQNYWDDFALKGIVKATDKQIEKIKEKISKKKKVEAKTKEK